MSTLFYVIAPSGGLVGAIIQAVCGFGYGPVNVSLLSQLLPYGEALALAGICGSLASVFVAVTSWRHINFKLIGPSALGSILTAATSTRLVHYVPDTLMVRVLGGALVALGVYSLFYAGRIRMKASPLGGLIAGAIAGVTSGLFAIGGPPIAVYLIEATTSNDEYRATLNAHFTLTAIITTFMRWYNGWFTPRVVTALPPLLLVLLVGTWIGSKIFHLLDAKKLRTIVYSLLIVSGLSMLFK